MTHNSLLGQLGERAAEAYLQSKGYEIKERNYRYRRAEVDLIAAKDKTLVLVEVKTRSSSAYGFPEQAVTSRKEALLHTAAEHYIEQHQWPFDVRFDVISVLWHQNAPEIEHIEDAFH